MKADFIVNNFDTFYNLETKQYHTCCAMDLQFYRQGVNLIDGIALLVGGDCLNDVKIIFIANSDIMRFNKGEISYIEERYNIKI